MTKIEEAAEEKCAAEGNTTANINVHKQDCMHHIRNICINAMNKGLTKYLSSLLREDLDQIDKRLRVSTNMEMVLRAVDKEFLLCCNYAKGHGEEFSAWRQIHHPGLLLVPLQRTAGSRMDLVTKGAVPLYWNRRYYVEFLDEALSVNNENILQKNLFVALSSSEMIALARVHAIFHFAVCLPWRYLCGSTHKLKDYNWSTRKFGSFIDLLQEKLVEICNDGKKVLEHDFMMYMFKEFASDLPPFKEYLEHIFEEKLTPTIDKNNASREQHNQAKVIKNDLVLRELFFPERVENQDTDDLTIEMGKISAHRWITEFIDPKKACHDYVSSTEGELSWENTSPEVHEKLKGDFAVNDFAESSFAGLTHNFKCGRLLPGNAAATAQARLNGDFDREVLGHKSNGAFHNLDIDHQQSLICTALQEAPKARKEEYDALQRQRHRKMKRQALLKQKKLECADRKYADGLVYIEIYHSDGGWKTEREVNENYAALDSNNKKLSAIKEQINIRVKGFGWKDCHHPWSQGGEDYPPDVLKEHLVQKILPKERIRPIPVKPNIQVPSREESFTLGTLTKDVVKLDKNNEKKLETIRKNAKEILNCKDHISKLQPLEAPPVDNTMLNKRLQKKFLFTEPDGEQKEIWCKGKVVGVVRQQTTVEIDWDDEVDVTPEKLMESKWNTNKVGSWRLDVETKYI